MLGETVVTHQPLLRSPPFPGDLEAVVDEMVSKNVAEHPSGAGGVVCLLCGAHLKDGGRQNLKRHFRDMHLFCDYRFRCPVCGKVYKSENSLRTHASMYHKEARIKLDINECIVKP